jgi:hypothetical protein
MQYHSLIIQSDMQLSKRAKLSAAPYTEQMPTVVTDQIMGYYKDLLIPGIQFSKYKDELTHTAQDFQERLHRYLDSYDMPSGCYCEHLNATDLELLCGYDTIHGYTPGQLRCHSCVEYYAQYENDCPE